MKATICIFVFLLVIAPSQARTPAPPDPNSIQGLINDANDGDVIILEPRTYIGPGNYDIDFLGKAVTLRSIDPNDPATVAATIIDCNHLGRAFHFHTGEDPNSILDGLTIINGYSDYGGAVYCYGTSLAVSRCVFTNNSARIGGAVYYLWSNATITGCVFRDNSTISASAGAVRIRESSLTIADCTFEGNFAWTAGGAINCTAESDLTLINCVFAGNFVPSVPDSRGGALSIEGNSITIANCFFAGNSAVEGGALICRAGNVSVANCTFSANRADKGDALYLDWTATRLYAYGALHLQIKDSILWNGSDTIALGEPDEMADSTLLVAFCNIPGAWPGYGNIDADPCFVDPGYWDANGTALDANDDFWVNGDYHLKSQAGRWNPNSRSWVADNITSPCIDTADPNTPLGHEPFPNGARINMGAYAGTVEASKSYFGSPTCEIIVAGDINGDCIVNSLDFSLMAAHWLGQYHKTYPGLAADPNPTNGELNVSTEVVLTWTPGSNAISHDIYLGTDYTQVRNADKNSPEYKANETATTFTAEDLAEETPHYWRIDEVGPNGETTTGSLWSFTTSGKSRRCFPADTLVWADGRLVPIIDVVPGQKVGKVDSSPEIEWVQEHGVGAYDCYDVVFESGNSIVVVHSHNFLTVSGEWVPVENLARGSKLQGLNGPISITTVTKRAMPFVGNAYNLKIKGANLFYVGKDAVAAVDCSKLPK